MNQTITLLGFPGCPNTPELAQRLDEALRIARIDTPATPVDLAALPESDTRRGYAAPTILVGDRDLFGQPPAPGSNLTCRVYPGGLPSPATIAAALKEATNP